MLTLDATTLLQGVKYGLRKHYMERVCHIKEYAYITDKSFVEYLYRCNDIYLLKWLYENAPCYNLQDTFNRYIREGAIDCIKLLYKLKLDNEVSMVYALDTNNLYLIKWVYNNLSTEFNINYLYNDIDSVYEEILDWLDSVYPGCIVDIETAIERDDFSTLMWYVKKYRETYMSYEDLAILMIYKSEEIMLQWLVDKVPIDYNKVMKSIIDESTEYNITMLWFMSKYPNNYLMAIMDKKYEDVMASFLLITILIKHLPFLFQNSSVV